MYKAVLFQRVSTDKQDTYRQNIELIKKYQSMGYSDEEVYVINYKESGVNLSYQQRKGMADLEAIIESNPIEVVLCHEISRVSRREDVTFTLIQKLTDRGINLHIQTPHEMDTLNPDGSENPITKLVITFLAYFAYEEAKQMKIRVKTGREAALKKGYVYTSSIKFGYRKVNRRVEIDPDDSIVVMRIFEDFIDNGMSSIEIFKKYHYLGLLKKCRSMNIQSGSAYICNILKDYTYSGEHPTFNYPAILDHSTIDKARHLLDVHKHKLRCTKDVYMCRGLLVSEGLVLSPNSWTNSYKLCTKGTIGGNERYSYAINANYCDTIAIQEALLLYSVMSASKASSDKIWAIQRIEEIKGEIETYNGQIEANERSFSKSISLYKRDIITIDDLEAEKMMITNQRSILEKKVSDCEVELANLTSMVNDTQHFTETADSLLSGGSHDRLYEIVHSTIERIEVVRNCNNDYSLFVIPKKGIEYTDENTSIRTVDGRTGYHYVSRGRWITLTRILNDGTEVPFDGDILRLHKASRERK